MVRLSAQRQAMAEFETTAQGCRLANRTGAIILIMHRLHEACPRA
jgi:hypothetical protein